MSKINFYFQSLGFLVGMIIGAGMFALPYAFLKAGLFWGLFHLGFALFFILVLHIFYGEIAFLTGGRHRFPGYVKKFLGEKSSKFSFLITIFSYYGTLLVYGVLGGIFLHNIFPAISVFFLSVLFFGLGAFLLLFRFEKIGLINFYLTVPLLAFILYLLAVSAPHIRLENFLAGTGDKLWFLPYGVWIFALSGFAVIPEARDIFNHRANEAGLKDFKRIIAFSILISLFFYLVFIFAVLGSGGILTSPDALSGLKGTIGEAAIIIGSLIGFLAVFTSYLALGADFKNIFMIDYNRSFVLSWCLVVLAPIALYLFGFQNFVKAISLIGALGLGIQGTFIVLMSLKLHKFYPEHRHLVSPRRKILNYILIFGLILGVAFELWQSFG